MPQFFESQPPPFVIPGMLEAEALTVRAKSPNVFIQKQETKGFAGRWTQDSHLFGMTYMTGDWVEWFLPKTPGQFELSVYMTKSNDYGIVQFSVNGQKIGPEIDLWNANAVVPTGKILLGEIAIGEFVPILKMEVIGKNSSNTSPHVYFGIDGILLEKK